MESKKTSLLLVTATENLPLGMIHVFVTDNSKILDHSLYFGKYQALQARRQISLQGNKSLQRYLQHKHKITERSFQVCIGCYQVVIVYLINCSYLYQVICFIPYLNLITCGQGDGYRILCFMLPSSAQASQAQSLAWG